MGGARPCPWAGSNLVPKPSSTPSSRVVLMFVRVCTPPTASSPRSSSQPSAGAAGVRVRPSRLCPLKINLSINWSLVAGMACMCSPTILPPLSHILMSRLEPSSATHGSIVGDPHSLAGNSSSGCLTARGTQKNFVVSPHLPKRFGLLVLLSPCLPECLI